VTNIFCLLRYGFRPVAPPEKHWGGAKMTSHIMTSCN